MAIYFVDGDYGDDNNNGTSIETAWKTIHKALNTIQGGDICYVKPTIYRFSSTASLTNSGSTGNYIQIIGDYKGEIWGIKAYPRLTPLDVNETTIQINRIIDINGKNYFIIEGLLIESGSTSTSGAGMFIYNDASYCIVRNCVFIYTLSRSSTYEQSGLVNAFYNSGTERYFYNNIFIGGYWSLHSLSAGLVLNFENSSNANCYVYNNLFIGGQKGIAVYNKTRSTIYNNTFIVVNTPITYTGCSPYINKNNYSYMSGNLNNVSNYNIIYPYLSSYISKPIHFDFTKIKFLITNNTIDNTASNDYIPSDDLCGDFRPQGSGYDVGCFEFNYSGVQEDSIVKSGNYSLKINQSGIQKIKTFLQAGEHTISVYTKWSNYSGSNKPQLIVKQDAYCGITSDQTDTATGDGSDWEELSVNISLTKDAEIEIWLYARDTGSSAVTYFDDLNIT